MKIDLHTKSAGIPFLGLLAAACAFSVPFVSGGAPGTQQLVGHVPALVRSLQPTGRVPADQQLRLAIALPLRNTEALTNLLREIYDPASINYHHYLSPREFAERFGP